MNVSCKIVELLFQWNGNGYNIYLLIAGTIVGDSEYLRDLFINIYRWSLTTSNQGQLSDHAYNVLINQTQYKDIVQKVEQEEGFATQLGTVWMKKTILEINY